MTPDDPPIEDLDRLEQALLDNIAALEPAATLGDREQPIRRGSALTGALALELFEAQLLSRHVDHTARWLRKQGAGFYTIGSAGPRGQRRRRRRAAPHRPGVAALPLGRLLPRTCPTGSRPRRRPRRARRDAGAGRRADRGRTPQGVRPPRPRRHPPDLDDRLAPAPGGRCGVRHRTRQAARRADARGPSMRSRSARSATPAPTTRRRRARSTPPATPPIKVCRCRCCSCARTTAGASACRHRRAGSRPRSATSAELRYEWADGSDLADTYDVAARSRRLGAHQPPAGVAAPAHGAVHGSRRHRRRDRVPLGGLDP